MTTLWIGGTSALAATYFEEQLDIATAQKNGRSTTPRSFVLAAPHPPESSWIDDLSRPDAMPLGVAGFETLNLLPLLMAAATMAQMRFQVKPADPQQAQTQKIMGMVMPIFMLWFLYSYSSGLSLYIFTSSLLGIFEYQVIRRIWPVAGMPAPGAKA